MCAVFQILAKCLLVPVFYVAGVVLGKLFCLSGLAVFHLLCWDARPYFVCWNLCALHHNGTCCNDGAFSYVASVKHGGVHSDECSLAYYGAMHHCSVPDGHVIFKYAGHGSGLVYACTVLYVDSIATPYRVDVRP